MCKKGKCRDCRFSFCGDFSQPMIAAHQYESEYFKFIDTGEDIIALPFYELECDNERNWRPSRGNMLVTGDNSCAWFEPKTD